MKKLFYTLNDKEFPQLGGKAEGLFKLSRSGLQVPLFYIFPNEVIFDARKGGNYFQEIISEWIKVIQPNKNSLWAVRSSAEIEDGYEKSYAGLFTSVLNCKIDELPTAFLKVTKSFEEVTNSTYHNSQKFEGNIILQEMINGLFSGVGFSVDPQYYESQNPVINVLQGLGNNIVSGKESSLSIELLEDGSTQVLSNEETFFGDFFINGTNVPQSLSKEKLLNLVHPYLSEIRSELIRLGHAWGNPIDTEFAILGSKIYWLQVRPITNCFSKKNYTVWDNSNISTNYPGMVFPLTSSFVQYAYTKAYSNMFSFLGAGKAFFEVNSKRFLNAVGTINGALYYNITAWQEMLWQMPFGKRTSKMLPQMIGADNAHFEQTPKNSSFFTYCKFLFNLGRSIIFFGYFKRKYVRMCTLAFEKFDYNKLSQKTHQGLIEEFHSTEKLLTYYLYAPMLNGFFTMLSYKTMQKILFRSRLNKKFPNLLNDALSSSKEKVVSVEIVRSFQALLETIAEREYVRYFFLNNDSTQILEWLIHTEPIIYEKIACHIQCFGERCDEGELKMETINYKEDPLRFIDLLKNNLVHFIPLRRDSLAHNYHAIIRKEYQFNLLKRWLLFIGINYTINRVRDRENFRFIRTKSFHLVRQIFREMDNLLLKNGIIEQQNDSLYLEVDELTTPSKTVDYKSVILERKKRYKDYETIIHHDRYYESGGYFFPVQKKSNPNEKGLFGKGCSNGIASGSVIIVDEKNIQMVDVSGKIIVAKFFEPGWIGLFSQSVGMISERGSLLSHTAILCRELNIPFIVGVNNLLEQLKNHDRIQMDGARGTIIKLEL